MNQINKLAWLVDLLKRHTRLTFEEINDLWMDNREFSDGKPLPKRTFHTWRQSIIDTFGLYVKCDESGSYRYYIANPEDLKENSMEMWLVDTFSVCNSLMENRGMKERIILENVPSGSTCLDVIIGAMRKNSCVHFTYHNYVRDDHRTHVVEPYFVKLFKRRWYLIGKSRESGGIRIYSLDRMESMKVMDNEPFVYPQDFSPEEFFRFTFGIYSSEKKPERILLKTSAWQAFYMRALPLMKETQKEIETTEEYSVFSMMISPTFDFKQELLRMGDTVEVLEPKWLRKEMKDMISKMKKMYG